MKGTSGRSRTNSKNSARVFAPVTVAANAVRPRSSHAAAATGRRLTALFRWTVHKPERLRKPRKTTKNVVHDFQQERRRRLAYCSTKEDIEPQLSVTHVNDITQLNSRDEAGDCQVFHHYLPDRRSQTRGVTAFAPMADTADQSST